MTEYEQLIHAYEHLNALPRAADALHTLRKVASLVKPLMRNRGWHVGVLTEFYPSQANLLGLNVNGGQKICLRLRYPGDHKQFLPMEEVVDTMLHELSHIVHGPHDDKFHALWNTLRDEHQGLTMKGYTGEGFLSGGQVLGGRSIPIQEMRRQARAAAETRKTLAQNSGKKLGGTPVLHGVDMRSVIADAATRRIERTKGITQGCASGTQDAVKMADQASQNGFKTKAEEDDANDRAIAQALWELMQEDEARNVGVTDEGWKSAGLTWNPQTGLQPVGGIQSKLPPLPTNSKPPAHIVAPNPGKDKSASHPVSSTEEKGTISRKRSFSVSNSSPSASNPTAPSPAAPSTTWSCQLCTLINPLHRLSCDACGSERPRNAVPNSLASALANVTKLKVDKSNNLLHPDEIAKRSTVSKKLGWNCRNCGSFMNNEWWTCSLCGRMKDAS